MLEASFVGLEYPKKVANRHQWPPGHAHVLFSHFWQHLVQMLHKIQCLSFFLSTQGKYVLVHAWSIWFQPLNAWNMEIQPLSHAEQQNSTSVLFLVQSLFMQLQGWRVKIITQAETCLKWPSTDSQIHVLTVKIGQWGCALLSAAFSWFFHLIVILGWTAPLARLNILAYRQLPSPFGLNFCFADSDSSGICSKVKGWSGIGA